MNVVLSDKAGFCFGVRRIDALTEQALREQKENPKIQVCSFGTLIHNPQYVARRKVQGLKELDDEKEIPHLDAETIVILRAHGIPRAQREALEATGAHVVDGTCPVLQSIYRRGQRKNAAGYRVVIVGDPNHPEVRAMRTYFDADTVVLHSRQDAINFLHTFPDDPVHAARPLYVISQTTNRLEAFMEIAKILTDALPDTLVENTICNATKERQEAAAALAKSCDAFIVIGGHNSSNTQKLAQVVRKAGIPVYAVEILADLPLQNMQKMLKIGITAGASTPDWIIQEVLRGMENFSNEEFMEQVKDSMIKIYPKDIVKGTVIAVKADEVYVDIKFRSDGIIKTDEMTDEEKADTHAAFHEGDEIDVYVIKLDDGENNVVLSTRRVEGLKNWNKLVALYDAKETVEARVTADNSGGLVVNVMGINGFIPASQITTYFVKNFKQFVGQTLPCKIISIDEKKRRVVLSSRAVKEEQLDSVWEGIVVGERIKGTVVRMTDFGAFVDLGGVDGLIHVSDISWERIGKPSDVLEIGQEVEPLVLKANRERNRISLGLKQLTPKPFEVFVQNNAVGETVKGTVVNLLDFGAFVRLKEGVEGLIHVSQIANHHVEKPSDELTVGQEVEVKILEIDTERQRIALSMRALQEAEKREESAAPARDRSRFERRVQNSAPKEAAPRRPRREPEKFTLSFDENSDIGTNLGDLISAKLGLANETVADAAPEEKTETNDATTGADAE